MKKTLLASAMILAMSSSAFAAEGFYVYGGLGYSKADTDLTSDSYSDASLDAKMDVDEDGIGLKLAAGYRFNDYFAVEGSYVYLGKAKADVSIEGNLYDLTGYNVNVDGQAKASMKAHVLAVDAVGIYPVTDKVELFAKAGVGVGYVKTEASYSGVAGYQGQIYEGSGSLFSESDTRVFPKLGVGAEFKVAKNVAVRAEYERYFGVSKDSDYSIDADYDLLSVGVKYTF